jgi:hypothetical protein
VRYQAGNVISFNPEWPPVYCKQRGMYIFMKRYVCPQFAAFVVPMFRCKASRRSWVRTSKLILRWTSISCRVSITRQTLNFGVFVLVRFYYAWTSPYIYTLYVHNLQIYTQTMFHIFCLCETAYCLNKVRKPFHISIHRGVRNIPPRHSCQL